MEEKRGVLFLADPTRAVALPQEQLKNPCLALIFDENERLLPQAQEALREMRERCDWVCVAGSGAAAIVAAALAAQLPVERLALADGALFGRGARLSRELSRLRRYARRNLSLVVSELLLVNVAPGEISAFARILGPGRLGALETGAPPDRPWESCAGLLCAPWPRVNENNLLIPWKCV